MRIDKIRSFHIIFACALVALCLGAYMITLSEPAEAAGKPCHKGIDLGVPGALGFCLDCCQGNLDSAIVVCTTRFPDLEDPRGQRCEARAQTKFEKCEVSCELTFPPG